MDIREGSGADLEEWLLHRHVDLAILQDPPSLPDIEITPMLTESLGLVAPVHSHLMADSRPASLRELGGESLILPGPQHWIRRRLEIAAQQSGMRLNMVLQVNSTALAKVMVRSGLGCTILPRSFVQDDIARGALALPADRPAAPGLHARDRVSPRRVEHAGAGIRRHGVRRDGHAGREAACGRTHR